MGEKPPLWPENLAIAVLGNQNALAFFLWTLCTAMVMGAVRAGLYVELLGTLYPPDRYDGADQVDQSSSSSDPGEKRTESAVGGDFMTVLAARSDIVGLTLSQSMSTTLKRLSIGPCEEPESNPYRRLPDGH